MSLFAQTRRQMLMGLASASAAAATGASAAGAVAPQEDLELLALADKLDGTTQAYTAAAHRVAQIVAEWSPQWPTPARETIRFHDGAKTHRGIDGWAIEMELWPQAKTENRRGIAKVGTPETFERGRDSKLAEYVRKMATPSQRGAQYPKRMAEEEAAAIEPARAYWAEVERIKSASGIEAAKAQEAETREVLHALVGAIVMKRETSITGLVIKAQAMQAWSKVGKWHRVLNIDATAWADEMAATIVRQAGAEAMA